MYKFAAKNRLRFNSVRGYLTTEQLFQLPLKATDNFDLDTVAKEINNELKATSEESFVDTKLNDPRRKELEILLDIVKDVIKTKQEEQEAQRNRLQKAERRRKILDALSAKQDQKLSEASIEELEEQLAALD